MRAVLFFFNATAATEIYPLSLHDALPISATFTIAGQRFADNGFGRPVANFTRNGALLGQARATTLGGSTTLTVPFPTNATRPKEHTPELPSRSDLVCPLILAKPTSSVLIA